MSGPVRNLVDRLATLGLLDLPEDGYEVEWPVLPSRFYDEGDLVFERTDLDPATASVEDVRAHYGLGTDHFETVRAHRPARDEWVRVGARGMLVLLAAAEADE